MGFVTPALLGGILLVGVPIVLHLVMRREVQQFVFPALRFVQQRKAVNQHRLKLRQLLLLALRCAVICLLAFALARPTLRGNGATGREDAPIAAALVFDNSLRMTYEYENETRFDQARKLAGWLLEQMPPDAPITVVDRASRYGGRESDKSAAELRIERLEPNSVVRPLEDALRDAVDWIKLQTDHRGEVYVFTDLAAVDWSDDALAAFKSRLDEAPGARVYVVDVGVERPHNLALGSLRLSGQELAPNSLLQIDTDLSASGSSPTDQDLTVELQTLEASGGTQNRGQQVLKVPAADEAAPVEFSLSGLPLGTHQGFVRVVADDPLACDDIRYFTIEVREPRKVLLLGESTSNTLFLREALAPSSAAGVVRSKFACESRTFAELDSTPLADFDAVCLIDPTALTSAAWQALTDYVHSGGGLGIFLGRNARRDPLNEPAPQQLLPAKLRWQSRDATFLRPTATEHPALRDLAALGDAVPWSEFPVFKFWELESPADDVYVLAPFANSQPALVERRVGAGRVITMTTPVSDPAYDDPWNLLPTGPDPWPFLALANGVVDYLVGAGDKQLNYQAGQTAVLYLSPQEQVSNYVLDIPGAAPVRQTLTPGQTDLSVASTEALGNYRVRAGGQGSKLDRGFSVNCATSISELARVENAKLIDALGKDRVQIARSQEEIEVRVGQGRVGRELFPLLIIALALALGVEMLLANRFYRDTA
ncbi:MAG: BatA domain-containing protein [Pirellulales bacterium]